MKLKSIVTNLASYMNKRVDKLLHFLACFGITLTIAFLAEPSCWLHAVMAAMAASFAKELVDQWLYHGFDWMDIVADLAGICAALAVALLEVAIR